MKVKISLVKVWEVIDSLTYRLNDRIAKQWFGSWVGTVVFVLILVSGIANILTVKLLPTIIFSSITLIGPSSVIVAAYKLNLSKDDFRDDSREFFEIIFVTIVKLVFVISHKV